MGTVISLRNFINEKDLSLFSTEIAEQWETDKYEIIDNHNSWWESQIEREFYEDCFVAAKLTEEEIKFVLSELGY